MTFVEYIKSLEHVRHGRFRVTLTEYINSLEPFRLNDKQYAKDINDVAEDYREVIDYDKLAIEIDGMPWKAVAVTNVHMPAQGYMAFRVLFEQVTLCDL